ncbi:SdrD B-like domain-containing protein, partial [Corynebacterium sp.]|uniref:SdrD B-like domain-containing protein n=1 Tax=Corynebacterium sp. TaxID=1720 RepID=UPI0026DB927D
MDIYKDVNTGAWIVDVVDHIGDNFNASLTVPATVNTDVQAGQEMKVQGAAEGYISPIGDWEDRDPNIVPTDQACVQHATGSTTYHGGSYGAWIVEAFIGSDQQSLQLIGEPKFRFTDKNNNDITEEVMRGSASDNPNIPPVDDSVPFPNGTWLYKHSWPFNPDPNSFTGRNWITDGTTIHWEQDMRDGNCDPARPYDWNYQINFHVISGVRDRGADVSVEAPFRVKAASLFEIGDYAWVDANKDGIQDAGEDPAVGVTVILRDADGEVARTKTDASGKYLFENLPAGSYEVEFVTPDGFEVTKSEAGGDPAKDSNGVKSTVELTDASDTTVDFGVVPVEKTFSIGDYAWVDANKDGIQDAG